MIRLFPRTPRRLRRRRKKTRERGVALVIVLSSLAILAVMLTEFQDETSADFGHALVERDGLKAEYAAKSAVNLSRLLLAAEPTMRKAIAPLFLAMKQAPPQIPVWEYANEVLGAFNDKAGAARFRTLAPVDLSEGKSLGMEGAGFEVQIVDEDSKVNFNLGARDAITQQRFAAVFMGLVQGNQYDPLFEERDREGNFNTRQQICAAIVDWADSNQDDFGCDLSGQAIAAGAEDGYYQLLDDPYPRKNAPFDSLAELHLVRGVNDDFWATFIEPDITDPKSRVATVWGGGRVNVNTANPQATLGVVCSFAVEGTRLCDPTDVEQRAKFLGVLGLVKSFTAGFPLFPNPKSFIAAMKGRGGGLFGPVMAMLEMEPVTFKSEAELAKAIDSRSRVFSIYATGIARSGKRQTLRRIHAVVDFRGAPAPPDPMKLLQQQGLAGAQDPTAVQEALQNAQPQANLPNGASEDTLEAAFRPDPGGRVIYYRID